MSFPTLLLSIWYIANEFKRIRQCCTVHSSSSLIVFFFISFLSSLHTHYFDAFSAALPLRISIILVPTQPWCVGSTCDKRSRSRKEMKNVRAVPMLSPSSRLQRKFKGPLLLLSLPFFFYLTFFIYAACLRA